MSGRKSRWLSFSHPPLLLLRLGCKNFTEPPCQPSPGGDISKSLFFPDEAINQHPRWVGVAGCGGWSHILLLRFATLTANIRRRRGKKVAINVPSEFRSPLIPHTCSPPSPQKVFHDENTPRPFVEKFEHVGHPNDPEGAASALPDHIYMDAMGFGMGNSCLQVTFQARK